MSAPATSEFKAAVAVEESKEPVAPLAPAVEAVPVKPVQVGHYEINHYLLDQQEQLLALPEEGGATWLPLQV